MTEEVKELIENIGSDLKAYQAKNDENIKKYDGANADLLKKMEETIADNLEAKQKIEQLETAINQGAKIADIDGKSSEDEKMERKEAYNAYFKKGDDSLIKGLVEKKALSVNSDSEGGMTVSNEMQGIITTRLFETSPVRGVASIETLAGGTFEGLIDDDEATSGGWTGETSSRSETGTPQLHKVTIEAHEQYAEPRATQKLLDDSAIDIEAWLSGKVADIFTRTENTAFVSGDGASKPKGFLSYGAWSSAGVYEFDKIEQILSGASGAVAGDGLISTQNALKEIYQPRAVWMMKRGTFGAILKLKDSDGRYLFGDGSLNNTNNKEGALLLGSTVKFADDMPAVGADALSIAYGDFGAGYQIVDRLGVRVLRDAFTAKPYIKFYTTKRAGGGVIDFDAIKINKITS